MLRDVSEQANRMIVDYPADLYAALHTGNEGDVRFYQAVCAGTERVVELGCGAGRLLRALAEEVADLHGVDTSEDALRLAREQLPDSVGLHRADMASFDVGREFDRVLIPFNGIYCLPDLESVERTFSRVAQTLAPDGLLVFDGYAGDAVHEDGSVEEGFDEEGEIATVDARGKTWRVFEKSNYDRAAQRFSVYYRYLAGDGEGEIRTVIHHRYLRLHETIAALERAGLELLVVHGGFDQRVYDDDADHMIVTARRQPDRDNVSGGTR